MYKAIQKILLPFQKKHITENWIKDANVTIMDTNGTYREKDVYIGTLTEAVCYPLNYKKVPNEIAEFMEKVNFHENEIVTVFQNIAQQHMDFERIHPFQDGNATQRHQLKVV